MGKIGDKLNEYLLHKFGFQDLLSCFDKNYIFAIFYTNKERDYPSFAEYLYV